jgi:hypothetical protein
LAGTAKSLSKCHTLEEVKAGIAWVGKNASEADSPPAILVLALRDGTARAVVEAEQVARAKVLAVERLHLRAERIRDLFTWTEQSAKGKGEDASRIAREMWQQIESVWPQPEQAAEGWDIPDAELFNPQANGWGLLRKLVAAAKQQAECHAPPSP